MGQPIQGTVTAASATKLTVQTDAGDSYDVTVTDTARIMTRRLPSIESKPSALLTNHRAQLGDAPAASSDLLMAS